MKVINESAIRAISAGVRTWQPGWFKRGFAGLWCKGQYAAVQRRGSAGTRWGGYSRDRCFELHLGIADI